MISLEPGRFYNEAATADLLGLSPDDVQTLERFGELRARSKVGQHALYSGTAIGAYMRKCNPKNPGFVYRNFSLSQRPTRSRIGFDTMKDQSREARMASFERRTNAPTNPYRGR